MATLRQQALTAVALPPPPRPQFLESCDEVILLEDGEICEKGTHKELMEERGRYAKLVHNLRGLQFKVAACGDLGPGAWAPRSGLRLGQVSHCVCRRHWFCPQDPEHIYNAAMVEALQEGPVDRDEGAVRAEVESRLLCYLGLSGHRPLPFSP